MSLLFLPLHGPNTIIDEAEEVPLRGSFGLEVPEDPAVKVALV